MRRVAWVGAVLLACSACQSIVGIRERELGSSASAVSTECVDYCAHVTTECEKIDFPAYAKTSNCEALCENLDPPESAEGSLTLACLKEHTGTLSEPEACESASPSGGGHCGERCEVYCKLYVRICDAYPAGSNSAECQDICKVLDEGNQLDGAKAFDGGDTLQCRLAHLSAAAAEAMAGSEKLRQMHCGHARADLSGGECIDDVPKCERYCTVVMKACVGTNQQQYERADQCKAVCAGMSATKDRDKIATSLACRLENAYYALETPAPDVCMRAGPAGGGASDEACGSSCRGYCEQLSQACATAGFEIYGTNNPIEACTDECTSMGHDTHMRRFKCRLDNIAKALVSAPNDKTLCDNAFGKGPCAQGTNQ